jgi:hypothetical protein
MGSELKFDLVVVKKKKSIEVIFRNYDSGAEVFNSNNGKLKIKRKIK